MSKVLPRCYIDSNVIIDYVAFECGRSICDEKQMEMDYVEKIFQNAKDNSILLFSSDITKLECLHAGDSSKVTEEIKTCFRSILDSGKVIRSISVNSLIIERARDMQWEGFPLPGNMDKIHIASAIFAKCSELITFDGFRRKYYVERKLDDFACIEHLCTKYNISVVFPSESVVAQRECLDYINELRALQKKDEEEKRRQRQGNLFDM